MKPVDEMQNPIDKCIYDKTYTDKTKPWTDQELTQLYNIKLKRLKFFTKKFKDARNAATKAVKDKKENYYKNKFQATVGNNKKIW